MRVRKGRLDSSKDPARSMRSLFHECTAGLYCKINHSPYKGNGAHVLRDIIFGSGRAGKAKHQAEERDEKWVRMFDPVDFHYFAKLHCSHRPVNLRGEDLIPSHTRQKTLMATGKTFFSSYNTIIHTPFSGNFT